MGEQLSARRKRKNEFAGIGCVLQAFGLVALFFFPIGTVLGLVLLVYGSMKSQYYACGGCGNRLADKDVTMCPTCHARVE